MHKFPSLPGFQDIPKDYRSKFTQIQEHEIRIMWHYGWYDGPLNGICAYRDKPHWFEQVFRDHYSCTFTDTDGVEWFQLFERYLLIDLSDEQYQEELYWHNLHTEKVGTYWDWDESGNRVRDGYFNSAEMISEYREAVESRKPRDFSNNKIVGWFDYLWGKIETNELD